MRRNWDKLREVLEAVEAGGLVDKLNALLASRDEKEGNVFIGHLLLCLDSRLVEGIQVWVDIHKTWQLSVGQMPVRLTMAGHDMLDSLRRPAPPQPERRL